MTWLDRQFPLWGPFRLRETLALLNKKKIREKEKESLSHAFFLLLSSPISRSFGTFLSEGCDRLVLWESELYCGSWSNFLSLEVFETHRILYIHPNSIWQKTPRA